MDPVLMAGAWAAALLSIAALARLAYHATVKGIRLIFQQELARVWRDMDDIEKRLSALEAALGYVREQVEQLTRMMQAHVEGSEQ
jgi:septal ring factor EnvC (AmiA/AmiB activator)